MVLATVVGFVGGKAYVLVENAGDLQLHHLGASGFTWYGGLIAGAATFIWLVTRKGLPLAAVAGISAAPLAVAYGIGRIGCFLAGDATYGRPTTSRGEWRSRTYSCRLRCRCILRDSTRRPPPSFWLRHSGRSGRTCASCDSSGSTRLQLGDPRPHRDHPDQ